MKEVTKSDRGRMLFNGLVSMACSTPSYPPLELLPRDGDAHNREGLPTSFINQENALADLTTCQTGEDIFSLEGSSC